MPPVIPAAIQAAIFRTLIITITAAAQRMLILLYGRAPVTQT